MALVECPECKKFISDQAPACPSCGLPSARKPSTPKKSSPPASPPPVDLAEVLKYVDRSQTPGNCRTVNGLGITMGGFIPLSGYPNIGFIKRYFSVMFLPLIPMGTYLVVDWDGFSGKFVGKMSDEHVGKFISQGKQAVAVALGAFGRLALVIGMLFLLAHILFALR